MIIEKQVEEFWDKMNEEKFTKFMEKMDENIKHQKINFNDEDKIFIITEALALRSHHPLLDFIMLSIFQMFDLLEYEGKKSRLVALLANSLQDQMFYLLQMTVIQVTNGIEANLAISIIEKGGKNG